MNVFVEENVKVFPGAVGMWGEGTMMSAYQVVKRNLCPALLTLLKVPLYFLKDTWLLSKQALQDMHLLESTLPFNEKLSEELGTRELRHLRVLTCKVAYTATGCKVG